MFRIRRCTRRSAWSELSVRYLNSHFLRLHCQCTIRGLRGWSEENASTVCRFPGSEVNIKTRNANLQGQWSFLRSADVERDLGPAICLRCPRPTLWLNSTEWISTKCQSLLGRFHFPVPAVRWGATIASAPIQCLPLFVLWASLAGFFSGKLGWRTGQYSGTGVLSMSIRS